MKTLHIKLLSLSFVMFLSLTANTLAGDARPGVKIVKTAPTGMEEQYYTIVNSGNNKLKVVVTYKNTTTNKEITGRIVIVEPLKDAVVCSKKNHTEPHIDSETPMAH